jgi:hypothetical protein
MTRTEAAAVIAFTRKHIARTLRDELGINVEVVVATSQGRGFFLSISGTVEECDAARALITQIDGYRFDERIEDELFPGASDFYCAA